MVDDIKADLHLNCNIGIKTLRNIIFLIRRQNTSEHYCFSSLATLLFNENHTNEKH